MSESSEPNQKWHNMSVDEVCNYLHTSKNDGLNDDEAAARLLRDGKNALPPPKRTPMIVKFLLQFHSPLIYMLILVMIFCFVFEDIVCYLN